MVESQCKAKAARQYAVLKLRKEMLSIKGKKSFLFQSHWIHFEVDALKSVIAFGYA
jgi:hypothetical protein